MFVYDKMLLFTLPQQSLLTVADELTRKSANATLIQPIPHTLISNLH